MTPNDNEFKTVRYALIKRRVGITREQFRRYWSDVHGPICAALPALAAYQQFYLGLQQPGLWSFGQEASPAAETATIIDGIAECGFHKIRDFEQWVDGARALMDDERNAFSGTYGYYTLDGRSRTLKEASAWQRRAGLHIVVLFRKRKGVDQDSFYTLVGGTLAPLLAQAVDVAGLRSHLFEPYEATSGAWHAGLIDHVITDGNRYEAALEIVVADHLALNRLFDGAAYQATLAEQLSLLEAAHTYRVDAAPVLIADGRATLAGRRGASIASIVEELGATNIR